MIFIQNDVGETVLNLQNCWNAMIKEMSYAVKSFTNWNQTGKIIK